MHWFYDPGFIQSLTTIAKSELEHFKSLRIRNLEEISVTDGKGNVYVCQVLEPKTGELKVLSMQQQQRSFPSIHLVQALAKGDRDELAIQAATELGCWAVIPWQAERSVSRWDAAKAKKGVERWQSIVSEASKQSLRAWDPRVTEPASTKQFCVMVESFDLVLVLEPSAETRISSVDFGALGSANICLVVGPEGGIAPDELQQLSSAGAKCVRLGREVLRTSTAPVAAISAILALSGQW